MNAAQALTHGLNTSAHLFTTLAQDLRDHPMARAVEGGIHATWAVGHVAFSEAHFHQMITGQDNPIASWGEHLAGGTTPTDDASVYPSYDEALKQLQALHNKTVELVKGMSESDLDRKVDGMPEEFEPFFGTVGKVLCAAIIHPMHHNGQLADIRRSLGRDPLIA
ncbi:DinB family protein [Phycisphaeraceae bacterium D3-23]